jgi:hypothetical protein
VFFINIKVLFLPANYTIQPQPLYLGIIHAFRCHFRKHLILRTAATADGGLLQDAAHMKLDALSAMHLTAEPSRLITPPPTKNCFVKCGFSTDCVSSNYDSAMKLREHKEDDWHSLSAV